MWLIETKREDLAETFRLALRGELRNLSQVDPGPQLFLRKKGLCLLWNEPPQEIRFLPSILVVEEDKKRDFLAWSGTYMPTLRPLTRLMRVLERDQLEQIILRDKIVSPKKRYAAAATGLVIAEALSRQPPHVKRRPLSLRDCTETFSFAFSQALFAGATDQELANISKSWLRAQRYNTRRLNIENVDRLTAPCAVLAALSGRNMSGFSDLLDTDIYSFAYEISETGKIPRRLLSSLSHRVSIPEQLLDSTGEGTRESRVTAFQEAISTLAKSRNVSGEMAVFVAGFLVSQISPGTLEYLPLLTTEMSSSSEILLWYGLLVGLHPDAQILDYENGAGWDIASQLLKVSNPWEYPSASFDLEEFEMLMSVNKPDMVVKTLEAGLISLELIPGSKTTLTLSNAEMDRPVTQRELFEYDRFPHEAGRLVKEINAAMRQLHSVSKQLERLAGSGIVSSEPTTANGRKR